MDTIQELMRVRAGIQDQLRESQSELQAVDTTIKLLQRERQSNIETTNTKEFAKGGLSDACRGILGSELVTPLQVRDRLMLGGYPAKSKSKLLSSVYATVKRLAMRGEIEAGKLGGKSAYRKKPPAQSGETTMETSV